MAEGGEINEDDLSTDIKDWNQAQVRKWILELPGMDEDIADTVAKEKVNGASLLLFERADFTDIGVPLGPAKLIIHARDELVELKKKQPGNACKPYPFSRNHDTYRYIENNILDTVESGASNFIEPCHEYKAFTKTTDGTKMDKFIKEVIPFAAACMNSRTNGTIHFGIGDTQQGYNHGQIMGVVVEDKEAYATELKTAIDAYFEYKHKWAAQKCIKPPRFVDVLNRNMTSFNKCVIEVDIAPDSVICEENVYHTYMHKMNSKKTKKKAKENQAFPEKLFYVREGGNTCNLIKNTKVYEQFLENVPQLSKLRKKAEEEHLSVIKSSTQGSRLTEIITGSTLSLDKSRYEHYVVVTNKSHPLQLESLGFLVELNPMAVLDFDPESATHGLQYHLDQFMTVSVHSPTLYKITEAVEDIAKKLKLTRSTSWVFCNGGTDQEQSCATDKWLISKGALVRGVISFLCRKDVLPNKRFLVIFLLLSTVNDCMDPLIETFRAFLQELGGTGQILCICDNEQGFTSWKSLIEVQCAMDISDRCIFELSFAEVNGTILSLWSKNRISNRFLSCGGGSKVLLGKKVEQSLDTLEVLCVNQCEGGNDDKITIEENFYRGGKVSWWNFYFSEQPGSTSFIKRDMFDYMKNTVIKELCTLKKACALLNLIHVTGCGGTTLAMHLLWDLREMFRCAVLKNSKADLAEVSQQVVKLLLHGHKEQAPSVPVLLMVDDFDDENKVSDLQQLIEAECVKEGIQCKSPQVPLLNCMRSHSSEPPQTTADTVFIGNHLSEKEQKLFEEKLIEIEKTHKNAETFYGFMIMKKNFKPEYIESVVRNTLKSFNIDQSPSQLLAFLVLLNVYCKRSCLSVSLCEEFLGLQTVFGTNKIEDGFGKFSTLICRCSVESKVVFSGVKVIHSSIAKQCLQELTTAHGVNKAEITALLLNSSKLYESTQGRDNLLQDVRDILVKRQRSRDNTEEESQFSPLIHEIARETPGLEEIVLENAAQRLNNDAIVSQLLARYYYLKKKDFSSAKSWAKQARHLSKDSSYIADTTAQITKHELKNAIEKDKEEPISPNALKEYLKMAHEATEAFKETCRLAKKESIQRLNVKTDNNPFNTSGCLGEVQVGVLVIDLLQKIPVFCTSPDTMSKFLSGNVKLQDIRRDDPWKHKNQHYYDVLQQFEDILCNLKYRMKMNFDFLDNFCVNMGFRSGIKDSREQESQKKLVYCFTKYMKLFCKTDSTFLKKTSNNMLLKLHQCRKFLESEKADSYYGILNCLSRKDIAKETMEKITKCSSIVCHQDQDPKEFINFIYANVVLSRIKLESKQLLPYQEIIDTLVYILQRPRKIRDNLPLFFIAVVLLWPSPHHSQYKTLGTLVSKLKTCYHSEMKDVYNGKTPVIHFLLGKKPGYDRLVHIEEIESSIKPEQGQFACMWGNGKIWKEKKVEGLLCRVTGEVRDDCILAHTCFPDLKLQVSPMYRSQISGLREGSQVSFFIGFSIRGPIALGIEM
ncbi:unnamed protein product [Ophioblennius macclurei]